MRDEEIQRVRDSHSRRAELLTFDVPDLLEDVEASSPESVVEVMTGWVLGLPWEELGRDAAEHLASYLVARGRALERTRPEQEHDVWYLFHKLKARFVEPHRLFVHGLSYEHRPAGSSWRADARVHADALLAMLCVTPHPPSLTQSASPDAPAPTGEQRKSWEAPRLEGADVYIVGGARRHHTIQALRQVTGAARVLWYETDLHGGMGKTRALAKRIERGSPAAVFLLKSLISHDVRNKLLDAGRNSATAVCLARGYGLVQLRLAWLEQLEREG